MSNGTENEKENDALKTWQSKIKNNIRKICVFRYVGDPAVVGDTSSFQDYSYGDSFRFLSIGDKGKVQELPVWDLETVPATIYSSFISEIVFAQQAI